MNLFDRPLPIDRRDAPCLRAIGELLREARGLSDAQVRQILNCQHKTGLRFGEAAVALRLATRGDVLDALSHQFQYTPRLSGPERSHELVSAADPFGDQADAFRELRSRLLLDGPAEAPRCALAVMSANIGDGKTYLAANLAVSFSQLREPTLLIDADIRTPRLHHILGVRQNGAGVSSVLAGFADPEALVHEVPGLPHLYLAPAGAVPPNPLELLQRPRFATLVRDLVQEFEHVLVDTPAAIRGADSRLIASRCGAALVVARRHRSRMASVAGLLGALERAPARLAGVVMNEH